jgi:hypothetical protein
VRRQCAVVAGGTIAAGFALLITGRLRLPSSLVLGLGLLQILQAELQLLGRELLRATAELMARQPLDRKRRD